MKQAARWSAWLLSLYGLLLIALVVFQRSLLYYPQRISIKEAAEMAGGYRMEQWRDGEEGKGEFMGWVARPALETPKYRCLIFHGNAGMALHRIRMVQALQAISERGDFDVHDSGHWEVYVMEYPGYGPREGVPGQEAFVDAGERALKCLLRESDKPVFILGESLGSGVAAQVVARQPDRVAGVLLVTPFDSMVNVAYSRFPVYPMSLLLWDSYRSAEALENYTGPVAVVVAEHDEVVPRRFGEALYNSYKGPKRLKVVEDAGHNTVGYSPLAAWWNEVFSFLTRKALVTRLEEVQE